MSERTDRTGGRGRGRIVALALGCVVLGGAIVGLVVAAVSDDDDDGGGGPSGTAAGASTTTTAAPLDEEGSELVELVERSEGATFTATYTFTDATAGAEQAFDLTVWRKGERNRQDIEGTSGGQAVHSAVFTEPGRSVACNASAEGTWQCQTMAEAPAPLDQLISGVRQQLGGRDVAASDDTIAGAPARCFAITEGAETAELCVRADGVPVRVSSGTAILELTSSGTEVDDAVFIPPAEPTGG